MNEMNVDKFLESLEDPKVEAEEALIMRVTETILVEMEQQKVTKAQLAERLGKSKPLITRILNGTSNITLRTLADICYALELTPNFTFARKIMGTNN